MNRITKFSSHTLQFSNTYHHKRKLDRIVKSVSNLSSLMGTCISCEKNIRERLYKTCDSFLSLRIGYKNAKNKKNGGDEMMTNTQNFFHVYPSVLYSSISRIKFNLIYTN